MPVQTLFDLAKRRLISNINMLDDIGDLPYVFLAPVLRHLQNPDQLAELEAKCPQLLGETGEIWQRFIKRDIADYEKKPHEPRDPKNWSKVYRKLRKDSEKEEEVQKEVLRQQVQALQNNRKSNQTTITEGRTGQVPSRTRKGFAFGGGSSWGSSGAPRQTGKAAFDKLRRGIFDQKQARPKASMMPAHVLAERKRTVQQAPARMMRQAEAQVSEAPQRMVLSKAASASVTARKAPPPITNRPNITSRPMPRPTAASPPSPQRPLVKRKREDRIFHEPKRRRP
ncbi:hypothetical protein P280DRAFT_401443 [Massarina eburnea CBS 473.64]|uniref:RNA polymerase II transcription factor SIII subunit A n=1 Tax=Massarina eburnea CBS 473.64 TaxID=1395130 RepID=A0A6A6RY70_9PLEO|nr:hypothetical protein P280DRAFT_401443 [Massarina eburnea CBS 473.64]